MYLLSFEQSDILSFLFIFKKKKIKLYLLPFAKYIFNSVKKLKYDLPSFQQASY